MTWEKIAGWIGSGLIAAFLGRTFLLWFDSRYITREEYIKATEAQALVTKELKESVTDLSEAIVAHSEQIKGLQVAQQTTNNLLQAIVSHVADINARNKKWHEDEERAHRVPSPE